MIALVPILQRGDAGSGTPAPHRLTAGAVQDLFPRWSVGTRKKWYFSLKSKYIYLLINGLQKMSEPWV